MARPPLVPRGPELTAAERTRFARHLLLPALGVDGQRRLRSARVLVVGAGGLGSPALLYLAAAGVGTLGVVDDDVVETTNLQRQVVHGVGDVGRAKVDSAADSVAEISPDTAVVRHGERLDPRTAMEVVADYDIVLDGADNFPTRYLVGDACARLGVPHVWGSVYRFDGQVSVWWAGEGPCYACVFPQQPAPDVVPSCAVGGVLGAVCASVGSVMATEAVKLVTGVGDPLVGRLLVHDALRQTWDELPVRRDPDCAVCGSGADVARPLGWATQRPEEDAAEAPSGSRPSVGVTELARLLGDRDAGSADFVLLDVREPGEADVAAIPGAVLHPVGRVRAGEDVPGAGQRVYVHCKSGGRSAEAVDLLRARGVDAVDVEGGILAWSRDVDPAVPTY
ncbi:molybdopterin-synthase adenylyltransferase MoeB [Phycicoccus sp. CSK15P-2]|uniref:molybdopterin-synthase adenylyltransferase MoeB n=1 Tax=Phycicoccus sp. CSK15P-2 TaxID=2807627 RepID=UPI00194F1B3F|nr:molybdopterin-synthase adenylyltransferase MoeB [Phycicoccus sp. CSK15P-2]MBM6405201.1 molybdopterin-synthase adenylyltransferase MoeB [Phycicoccus sp. CSK15P-2]